MRIMLPARGERWALGASWGHLTRSGAAGFSGGEGAGAWARVTACSRGCPQRAGQAGLRRRGRRQFRGVETKGARVRWQRVSPGITSAPWLRLVPPLPQVEWPLVPSTHQGPLRPGARRRTRKLGPGLVQPRTLGC